MSVAVPPKSTRASRTLQVGLIGCGERGEGCSRAISRTTNTRMTITMDANPARAQDLAARYGASWTTDLDQVLSHDQVDAVVISTPHHLHAQQAMRAAAAGKHVIIEKPMATSLEDAVATVNAARQAGVHLSVNLSYRYLAHVQRAKALIEAGALGELFGVALTYQTERSGDYWEGQTGRTMSDWRMRRETSGGGVLINLVIHYLDLCRYLPGRDIIKVSCTQSTIENPGDVEDAVSLWVRYENGAVGTVNASSCVRGTELAEFHLWGRDGHLSLTPPYQVFSLRVVEGMRSGRWHEFSGLPGVSNRDVEYFQRFAERIQSGDGPDVTAEDGLAVQAIVDAAYRSAQTGQTAEVKRGPWLHAESGSGGG